MKELLENIVFILQIKIEIDIATFDYFNQKEGSASNCNESNIHHYILLNEINIHNSKMIEIWGSFTFNPLLKQSYIWQLHISN